MSRHQYQTKKHIVVLGVDAPTLNLFGQVLDPNSNKAPKMLGGGLGYDATAKGLESLVAEASKYGEVPVTVKESLEHDLSQLGVGDISFTRLHGAEE